MSAAILEQPVETRSSSRQELTSISLGLALRVRASSRVEVLAKHLARAVTSVRPELSERRVRVVIAHLMSNFLLSEASAPRAIAKSREVLDAVGVELYRAGWTLEDLSAVCAAVHRAVFRVLNQVMGTRVFGKPMEILRYRIIIYMHAVLASLVSAIETAETGIKQEALREQGLSSHEADLWVGSEHGVRVIISVFKEFPDAVSKDPVVLSVRSAFEIVIAADVSWDALERLVPVQAVVGPVTGRAEFADGVALTWGAVRLLRTGQVTESRRLIPVQDLAGAVLVAGNSVMTTVLIDKHLTLLEEFPLKRRIDLARALLYWLESRVSYNQVAREMGVPPQTMHGRLTRLREIFGARLDDPLQRIEIIVALRSAIPIWRREPS